LTLSSAVSGAVLLSTQPILMPLLGWLVLRESIRGSVVAGAVVAFAGAILLVHGQEDHGGGSMLGDVFLTIGVLIICGAQLIARRIAQVHGRAMAVTSIQLTMAALVGLFVMIAVERPTPPFVDMDPKVVLTLLYLGVIGSTGPFFLYNYALRFLTVGMVSLILTLIGPLGALMSWLYLGTEVTLLDWIAISVVVIGVLLPTISERRLSGRHGF
ncbi:MAG: EamA family transporter, partial [Rhodospirillaceae bacterium]|nr:EamA family transporter [Rhodospirillaceae bacterium]